MPMDELVLDLACILGGIAIALIGLGPELYFRTKRRRCTVRRQATITSTGVAHSNARDGRRHPSYYREFRFSADGKTCYGHDTENRSKITWSKGQKIWILHNPDDPNDYYVEGDKVPLALLIPAVLLGTGLSCFGLYLLATGILFHIKN